MIPQLPFSSGTTSRVTSYWRAMAPQYFSSLASSAGAIRGRGFGSLVAAVVADPAAAASFGARLVASPAPTSSERRVKVTNSEYRVESQVIVAAIGAVGRIARVDEPAVRLERGFVRILVEE